MRTKRAKFDLPPIVNGELYGHMEDKLRLDTDTIQAVLDQAHRERTSYATNQFDNAVRVMEGS